MMTPATILRDTAIAGLVLTVGASVVGAEIGGAVAAGVLGSLANLALMMRVVGGANPQLGALFLARLLLKTAAGAVILALLVANLPAAPVLVGFCSVLLALSGRAVLGLGAGPANTSTPEPG